MDALLRAKVELARPRAGQQCNTYSIVRSSFLSSLLICSLRSLTSYSAYLGYIIMAG